MAQTSPSFVSNDVAPTREKGPRMALFDALMGTDRSDESREPAVSVEQINDLQGRRDEVEAALQASALEYRGPGNPDKTPVDLKYEVDWERKPVVAQ